MSGTDNNAISGSIKYIENRLTENLSINDLAEQAFFSRTHYQRLFRSIVGEPVMEYIKKRRLQLACRELCEAKATVLEIALKYGYESHEGFSRAFKIHFGVTPMQYRKMNAKHRGKKYHRKEDVDMLSNEVLNRITVNMEKIAEVCGQFQNEAEKLAVQADRAATAEGTKGATVGILSLELKSLAGRTGKIRDYAKDFTGEDQSVFEVFEKIYGFMKNLDDVTFQMNILRFFSGIETRRIGKPRNVFAAIDNGFEDLCVKLVNNKNSMMNLINDLISLIKVDIKKEAVGRLNKAVDLMNQTANKGNEIVKAAKEVSDNMDGYGGAFFRIANEVEKRTARVTAVAEFLGGLAHDMECKDSPELTEREKEHIIAEINSLEYVAFYMNISAFNSSIETARSANKNGLNTCAEKIRQYAGHLNIMHASCVDLYCEWVKLSELLQKGGKDNSAALVQKIIDDMLFQGEILSIQLGLESERINLEAFKTLSRNAEEALSAISVIKGRNDALDYRDELLKYYEATSKLAKDCRAEAAGLNNADTFDYISLEYGNFSERIKQVVDSIYGG